MSSPPSHEFALHARLAEDTLLVGDLPLSRVLLMNDCRYYWVILVPRLPGLRELHDLLPADRVQLLEESCRLARCLEALAAPDKLNIGILGNIVPQLHLHHVARHTDDPAWPGPVWGHAPAIAYPAAQARDRVVELWACLLPGKQNANFCAQDNPR